MPINGITKIVRLGARGPSGGVLSAATLTDHEARITVLETTPDFTGSISVGADSLLGDSQSDKTVITGKLHTDGNAPGIVIGAAAGSGASVGTIVGNDISGRAILNIGTGPAPGTLATFTFNTARDAAPNNVIANQASATGGEVDLYVTSITASGFVLGCHTAPTASVAMHVGWFVV